MKTIEEVGRLDDRGRQHKKPPKRLKEFFDSNNERLRKNTD